MQDHFFKRVHIFFSERYPLTVGILSSVVGTFSMYLIWVATHKYTIVIFDRYLFLAIVTMFLVSLILRLADEIKDKEADKVLFPDRCLPSGKVKYSDIYILLGFFFLLFLVANVLWGGHLGVLFALSIYIFLFFKYFFVPKIISKNILLALVTHNPLLVVLSFYLITIFCAQQNERIFSYQNLLLSIGFWMPSLAWETSRKIKAPHRENEYETYSSALGPRLACLLPLGAVFIQYLCLILLVYPLQNGELIIYGSGVINLIYLAYFSLFLKTLKSRYARYFLTLTEGQIISNSFLIVFVCFLGLR